MRVIMIMTLAVISKNLTDQVGYSNSLLFDVNVLESTYANAQQRILVQDDEIAELRELLSDAQNRIIIYQKQIAELQEDRVNITSTYQNLNQEYSKNAQQVEHFSSENEIYNDRIQKYAEAEIALTKKITELEVQVELLKHNEQESNRIGSSVTAKVSFENKTLLSDIDHYKVNLENLQNNYNNVRDENIQLKTSLERFYRLHNEESIAKEDLSRRNTSMTSHNVEMNNELQVSLQKNVQYEHRIQSLQHSLDETKKLLENQTEHYENQTYDFKTLEVCSFSCFIDVQYLCFMISQ